MLPPVVPVCPPPANVTQQSGVSSGVPGQGPLATTISVNAVYHVPGHHKTVPLKLIHHGQHFQTALGAVLQVGGTGSLPPGDTPGGAQGQFQLGTLQDSPGDRAKKAAETAHTWADTALKLEELARKFEEDADKAQKAADAAAPGAKKDALQKKAQLYQGLADTFHAMAADAGQKANGK
jgi:hypothetical protein